MQETVQLPESIKPKLKMDPKKIFMIASGGIVVVLVIVSIVLITVGNWNKDTSTTQGNSSQQYTDIVSEPISYPYYYQPVSYPDTTLYPTRVPIPVARGSYTVEYSEPVFLENKIFFEYTEEQLKNYSEYLPKKANIYKAGTVSSGSVIFNNEIINLQGKDYLVAFAYSDTKLVSYYRYVFDNTRNLMICLDTNDMGFYSENLVFHFTNFVNDKSQEQNKYKLLPSKLGNFFSQKDIVEKLKNDFVGTKVDSFVLGDIYYEPNSKNFYSFSEDGFLTLLGYGSRLVYYNDDADDLVLKSPKISWFDGKSSIDFYEYRNIGICPVGVEKIDFIDFDPQYFVQTGVDNSGSPVYEYKDGNNEYLKKIYNEDYIPIQMHKYNNITEDDNAPFTYEEFLKYHPVFIWQDTYGNYVRFTSYNFIMQGGCAKPIVYLYPTRPTSLDVSLEVNGELTFTYPEYKDKWSLVAYPDGQLIVDGDKYDYLWWESQKDGDLIVPNYGFVVEKSNLENFFTDKLSIIGLNSKEIADFNEYWVQKISFEKSDKVKITFLLNSEVDQIAKLNFSEKIDSLIRVFMVYSTENIDEQVVEQKLPTFKREGFTVVEWGGALVNN